VVLYSNTNPLYMHGVACADKENSELI